MKENILNSPEQMASTFNKRDKRGEAQASDHF
jgi:hypothetical protein